MNDVLSADAFDLQGMKWLPMDFQVPRYLEVGAEAEIRAALFKVDGDELANGFAFTDGGSLLRDGVMAQSRLGEDRRRASTHLRKVSPYNSAKRQSPLLCADVVFDEIGGFAALEFADAKAR